MPEEPNAKEDDLQAEDNTAAAPNTSEPSERSLAAIENNTSVTDTETVEQAIPTDQSRSWLKEEKKPPGKGMFLGIIAAVLVVVLAGSTYAVYALWYQNPEKVVMDSMLSAVTAETSKTSGDVSVTYNDFVLSFDFAGEGGISQGGKGSTTLTIKSKKDNIDIKLKGQGVIAPSGEMYFKVDDLKKVYNDALDAIINSQVDTLKQNSQTLQDAQITQMRQVYDSLLGPSITKVGDKWIKISADDIKSISSKTSKEYTCTQDMIKKVRGDKKLSDQLTDVYMKNRFLVVKENLGVKDGSAGYVVDIDKQVGKKFDAAVKDTTVYKDLAECSPGAAKALESGTSDLKSKVDSDDTSSDATYRVEIWADQWSHQLTRMNATVQSEEDGDKTAIDLHIKQQLNVPVAVTIPNNTVSLKDVFGAASVPASTAKSTLSTSS